MQDCVTTSRAPNSDDPQWYLVVHRIPLWFSLIHNLCNRWPLWRFYQQFQRWWWKKLDTFDFVRVPITDAQQKEVSDYWEREWKKPR